VGVIRDITERKAFERKLMELATIDGLTGALNRRAFLEVAENAFRLAQRYDRPLSVLMIDADHFKLVNDTHGHHVGDLVLARLAQICSQGLRSTDSFGRLGGEEFVALLPETDLTHAREVAERLVQAVREARVEPGDGRVITFTVSIGVTCAQWPSRDIDAVIQAADQQLYRAKNEGRDRVCG
jgi:diguanylate cyclase (GGDEF)-like protein